ncbi:TPA: hypothetical protein KIS16_004459 [Escherichia coli]|nr:hypothetical protein [Escherichia coli]EIH1070427.1 hypothetical protein [Escherichia coli O7:H18]QWV72116.1 hypothetical protein KQ220_20000 [Escherichia coli O158:H23]EHJ6867226.1 hypothetical protein [Escherichia coli]EHJ8079079.1 hypothetical protein [Escherichia coli]
MPCNTVNPDIFYCSIFNRLQEYLVKGFVMDDERLKNPPVGSSVLNASAICAPACAVFICR